jgi:Mg2+ and Co2+ transporter CorA
MVNVPGLMNNSQVRDISAQLDRSIQLTIASNTASDGSSMKIIAVLTVMFLPGTFIAVWSICHC